MENKKKMGPGGGGIEIVSCVLVSVFFILLIWVFGAACVHLG
jgi:hypothetical protein